MDITTTVTDKNTVQVSIQPPQPPMPDPTIAIYTMDQIETGLIDCDNGDASALSNYDELLAEHDSKRQNLLTMKQAILDYRTAHPD